VEELIEAMRREKSGIPIKDRRLANAQSKETQVHPKCFLGSEALDWLLASDTRGPASGTANASISWRWCNNGQEARAILNFLRRADIIYDITHDRDHPFNEGRFYRFREDDGLLPIFMLASQASPNPYVRDLSSAREWGCVNLDV